MDIYRVLLVLSMLSVFDHVVKYAEQMVKYNFVFVHVVKYATH